jgi:hypothetical protein
VRRKTGSYSDAYGAVINDGKTPQLSDGTPRDAPVGRQMCCS